MVCFQYSVEYTSSGSIKNIVNHFNISTFIKE